MGDFLAFIQHEVTSESLPILLSDLGLLPVFVRRVLLRKKTSHISPSNDEQISFQKSFFASQNITDKSKLDSWLHKNNIIESDMSLHLYRSLQVEMLKKQLFSSKVESFFLEHKSDFDCCYFSLLRTSSRESINELYFRLMEHEDTFSSLATEYSIGSESQSNGYIGPRPFNSIHPEFSERLRISRPGQLWSPFQVGSNWCIIRLERIINARLDTPTRISIIDSLFESWLTSEVDAVISDFNLTKQSSFDFTSDILNSSDLNI